MKRSNDLIGKTPLVDILTTMTTLFMLCWIISMTIEKAKNKQLQDANLRTEGVYAVVAEWPDTSPNDVDLYIRDPAGNIAFFSSRDVGLMHLEHDDQGAISDQVQTILGQVKIEKNEERVVIRGIIPGEYTVNVHMYSKKDDAPTPVKIRLVRLKGGNADVIRKERTLARGGDEQTAFRFTLGLDESVSDINEMRRSFMGSDGTPRDPMGGP